MCLGVGEYVDGGRLEYLETDTYYETTIKHNCEMHKSFNISTNAVIINEAHPDAILRGIVCLVEDIELRKTLGRNGRRTVEKYFRVERQMHQYETLYRSLIT
jgi:glycosyltransferase involved in cell wall biosynthesis